MNSRSSRSTCLVPVRALALSLLVTACSHAPASSGSSPSSIDTGRLPTGAHLDPAGHSYDVGSFPLAAVLSPDGTRIVLLLNGWREQGVQVLDRSTGAVVQTLTQRAAFLGIAFSPDGQTLYASGGNQDVVYRYAWAQGRATLTDSLILAYKANNAKGRRYPAGLAPSPDGRALYVAENLSDSLAVIDLTSGKVTQRLPVGRYPYGITVSSAGTVYVSEWGGHTVSVFAPKTGGGLAVVDRISVSRHPSALLLNPDGSRLFVASATTDQIEIIDTHTRAVVSTLSDPPASPTTEGSTPDAMALSRDGTQLFVAEADNNAIAVFHLADASSPNRARPAGRIPVGWYPSAVLAAGSDSIIAVNGKGRGTAPNATSGIGPGLRGSNPLGYTLGQISGTVTVVTAVSAADLTRYTDRVTHANGWDGTANGTNVRAAYPPFEHVIYIIKENRTYDQVLGDMPEGDGDSAIVFFPRPVSPNHHALAQRFGLYDRFFVNAEVSGDGHNWSTAAYATDYVEKTVPSQYSGRGRSYDFEGTNRDSVPSDGDDVASPSAGYLWDLALKKGISLRDYGEFAVQHGRMAEEGAPPGPAEGDKPALVGRTSPDFAPFDLHVTDQRRADVWISELNGFVKQGSMPALEIMHLGNDHTAGAAAGAPTPRAFMADNDLALGRIIEALSKTPFWRGTVVFVLEDDAQNGADHVDSHRSPLLVISAYNRGGVIHRFANTTDVLATIEEILGLGSMSPFDYYGRPLRDAFGKQADLSTYGALMPSVDLHERNPAGTLGARESRGLDLSDADRADETLFNHILWQTIKGPTTPEPPPRRASTLDLAIGR